MSYTIEYGSSIWKIPKEIAKSMEDHYMVIMTYGDNNVFEASWGRGRGRRARGTYITDIGWSYSVIQEICKNAGYCEGGSLQLNGKHTTPEAYIKRYRHLMADAKDIRTLFDMGGFRVSFQVNKDDDLENWQKEVKEKFKEYITQEPNHYRPEEKEDYVRSFHIKDVDSFNKFLELRKLCIYKGGVYVENEDDANIHKVKLQLNLQLEPVREQTTLLGGGELP